MKKTETPKLFGTDGIRTEVGRFPLDDASIYKLGLALGTAAAARGAKIIIGRDTRGSGQHIEQLIASGITGASAQSAIHSCGVIPTPGLSYITGRGEFDYGIMITASHNPHTDNGIKIFGGDGEKIPDHMEKQVEDIFFQTAPPRTTAPDHHPIKYDESLKEIYHDFLAHHAARLKEIASPLKVVLDCANGAVFELAPRIFREAGMETIVTHAAPDGFNINRECGSTHTGKLSETVRNEKADLGIAFDGDGDRVLFIDPNGRLLDGDVTLYMIARLFQQTRSDFNKNKIAVGTVMSNLGLEKALEKMSIAFIRTPVGDKHVYREMKNKNAVLGGEQSGHTILKCFQETGDGLLTALYFLNALAYLAIAPADVSGQLELYPQETRGIGIREKRDLASWDRLNQMIEEFNRSCGENSRLLIRYSGTEPKIRLMIESREQTVIDQHIGKFEQLIRSTIGA
jgi:phosphoglucosamine mutase